MCADARWEALMCSSSGWGSDKAAENMRRLACRMPSHGLSLTYSAASALTQSPAQAARALALSHFYYIHAGQSAPCLYARKAWHRVGCKESGREGQPKRETSNSILPEHNSGSPAHPEVFLKSTNLDKDDKHRNMPVPYRTKNDIYTFTIINDRRDERFLLLCVQTQLCHLSLFLSHTRTELK